MSVVTFDVETSTHNKGHPFDPRNWLVSYAIKINNEATVFIYYTDADFVSFLRAVVGDATRIVGFNIKFDLHWLGNLGIVYEGEIWDGQLAEFIYVGQSKAYASLADTLVEYNLSEKKKDLVAEYWDQGISTEHIPINILQEYNIGDVESTAELYALQQQLLNEKQKTLVYLQGEDMLSLMEAERNGYKWDAELAATKLADTDRLLSNVSNQVSQYLPKNIPEPGFNIGSGDQLSAFLYGGTITYDYAISTPAVYKSGLHKGSPYIQNKWFKKDVVFPGYFKPDKRTEVKKTKGLSVLETHFYQTSDDVLKGLRASTKAQKHILALLEEYAGVNKVDEMIRSIQGKMLERQWTDSIIHPQYNQNVVVTGRLSSSQPNMQNTPPEIDELLVSRHV